MDNLKRIAIFIDNSNVFHHLHDLKRNDKNWVCLYNPLILAEKLAGNRELVYIGFYCVHPPSYLLSGTKEEQKKYNLAQKYYGEIEKLPNVSVKFGDLKGTKGQLQEKNLDTQIVADMVTMAALNKYDVAILVSNDGDYKSAIESTKLFNKKIENLFFKGSLSMAIDGKCDTKRRARRSFFVKLDGLDNV
ncbi:MAG: NYN domain-containing protein [Candidatus Parcubacteria bacterium]|nr:NYN domain-containing protein [Candidatus Parcubacteria bacterium]